MSATEQVAGRIFDEARRLQGFRSQEHLDAFYAYYDHTHGACGECGQPGRAVWLEGSASWQPTMRICDEGKRLQAASDAFTHWPRHPRKVAAEVPERERQAWESARRLARYARGDVGYRLQG